MNNIKQSFKDTVLALLSLAEETIITELPKKRMYIRCYDVLSSLEHFGHSGRYELDCFLSRERCSEDQIIEDLTSINGSPSYIQIIDLELFYATAYSTTILAKVFFSDTPTEILYHASIPIATKNNNALKYELNDYAEELALRFGYPSPLASCLNQHTA